MTRLSTEHVNTIASTWNLYEEKIKNMTGLSLFEVASSALDLNLEEAKKSCTNKKVAVIPLSSGEGYIPEFVESVQSICEHLGFTASIVAPDEKGFTSFKQGDFDLCIWADDNEYFVENKDRTIRADNNVATGKGFGEILALVKKKTCHNLQTGLKEVNKKIAIEANTQNVIVRGCGPIGRNAALHLAQRGFFVYLFDKEKERSALLFETLTEQHFSVSVVNYSNPEQLRKLCANPKSTMLFDAAPRPAQEDYFGECEFSYISAPCVPCLWKNTQSLWHDPLQLGTAVMLVAAATNVKL